MNQENQFMVKSDNPPKVELSDAGVYVRFKDGVTVARTVVQNEWPHIAVDLDDNDEVIGIEFVPTPPTFSIGCIPMIAANARVGGLPAYRPENVQISHLCPAA